MILLVLHVSAVRFVLMKSQVFGNFTFNMVSYGVKHVHKRYKRRGSSWGRSNIAKLESTYFVNDSQDQLDVFW